MQRAPRVGVGALIVREDGQILLGRRCRAPEAGWWGILGGKVEFGETVENTVVREVLEESGLAVQVIRLLCVTDLIVPEEGAHWVAPAYLCQVTGGSLTLREPEAIAELAWFDPDKLPRPLTLAAVNALAAYSRKG